MASLVSNRICETERSNFVGKDSRCSDKQMTLKFLGRADDRSRQHHGHPFYFSLKEEFSLTLYSDEDPESENKNWQCRYICMKGEHLADDLHSRGTTTTPCGRRPTAEGRRLCRSRERGVGACVHLGKFVRWLQESVREGGAESRNSGPPPLSWSFAFKIFFFFLLCLCSLQTGPCCSCPLKIFFPLLFPGMLF